MQQTVQISEFSNIWFQRPQPLPRNIVLIVSVLDGATTDVARGLIGQMTDVFLRVLRDSGDHHRNRNIVKLLNVACNLFLSRPFRPVMSLSNRTLFDVWFLGSRPQA
jgi:hypothetical protein